MNATEHKPVMLKVSRLAGGFILGLVLMVLDASTRNDTYHLFVLYVGYFYLTFALVESSDLRADITANLSRFEELSTVPRCGTLWTKKGEIL